jgi:hypothetical protein
LFAVAKKYYVYGLIDPRTNNPFYIGKSNGNRIVAHEIEAEKGNGSRKCATIREIWLAGLTVKKVKIKEFSDEDAAYGYEKVVIAEIGSKNLSNGTLGGRCPSR